MSGHWLSHPGLIPEVVAKVAELKGQHSRLWDGASAAQAFVNNVCAMEGLDLRKVATALRENARALYGI